MKNVILKYIFTYLSAAYFLVGGMGYNVVNYCCQACASEGIEEIATSSCFNIHHHSSSKDTHSQNKFFFCSDLTQHIDNCQFLRLNTDIPSFQTTNNLQIEQIYPVCLFNFVNIFIDDKNIELIQNNIPPPESLHSNPGRFILTFHSVLLI